VMDVFKEAIKNKRKAMKEMAKEAKKRQAQEKAKEKADAPKTKTEAPKTEAPKVESGKPKTEAPKTEAPKPKTGAPKTETPKTEAPKPTAKPAETAPSAPPTATPTPPTVTPKPPIVKPAIAEAAKTAVKIAAGATGVFATSEAFAKSMFPYAKSASEKLGGKIPPEAILAQWAGESSNGKSLSAPFNYAGIKAGSNDKKGDYVLTEERYTPEQIKRAQQKGETLERVLGPTDTIYKKGKQVTVDQWFGKGSIDKAQSEGKQWVQVKSYFSKYDSPEEFVDGYVKVLSQNRYKIARESSDASAFGLEVAKAGYATASAQKYSEHIGSYIKQNSQLLDNISKENSNLKGERSQPTPVAGTMVNQNNITNRQRNVTISSPPLEELNPRMRH
jgi:flagellum-specific peptidoglycan hydrolase FlgJ